MNYNYDVVIDAGHGGTDPGAVGNGITEKDLNLKISELMYQRFQDLGVPVTLIRKTDETINPTDRVDRILDAYGDKSNVIVISNHINAGGGDGAEVIYALRNNDKLSNLIAREIQNEGQNIRNVYQRRLPSDPSQDYYFIHRNTGKTQPVIVEYGFLDSKGDDVTQLKNNYPQYVDAVVRAVMEYITGTTAPGGGGTYTVQSGDSLWSIAKKFNTTVDVIKSLNNLTSNTLRIGQVLQIPSTGGSGGSGGSGGVDTTLYIVKSGDSLYKIAQQFNTTVDDLMKLNNLSNTSLVIGQQLRVPGKGESNGGNTGGNETYYTVKSGDSLYKIAGQFNTTVDAIMKENNLTGTALTIGQRLRIPTSGGSGGNTGGTPAPEPPTTENTYTVKSGDSLYKIAQQFNTTVDAIMRANNLTGTALTIGQQLRIPSSGGSGGSTGENTYIVKNGDSLWKIASTYNTTVDAIKKINNLASNSLSIGQILIIPV